MCKNSVKEVVQEISVDVVYNIVVAFGCYRLELNDSWMEIVCFDKSIYYCV